MKNQLEQIRVSALKALEAAATPAALEELRVKLLGKKGELTAVLKQMGKLSAEERPVMGQLANTVRAQIEEKLETLRGVLYAPNPQVRDCMLNIIKEPADKMYEPIPGAVNPRDVIEV